MVGNYRGNTNKWTDAKITEKTGPLSYKVTTGDQSNWRRHADQTENTSDVSVEIREPNVTGRTVSETTDAQRSLLDVIRYGTGNLLTDCHISERLCK